MLQLGNNGPMSASQFEEVMALVADVDRVIWLTLHEPRSYEPGNNRVVTEGVFRHGGELVDWHTLGRANPGWFGDDGIHLTHAGRRAMADLIVAQLERG